MSSVSSVALMGALLQAVMALLFALVARATGSRWPWLMVLGCLCASVVYGTLAWTQPRLDMAAPPSTVMTGLIGLAYWLLTAALMSYLGCSRRLVVGVLGALLMLLIGVRFGIAMGWVQRASGGVIISLVVLVWAALCLRAERVEPRAGHGLVVVALVSFPLLGLAARVGQLSAGLAVAWGVVPITVVGMTLLTTGLLRAWRSAERELALRREAEQQLRAANDTLEQRVQQRTAQQSETIEGLESFTRSVSHDLRGPLGGIAGLARIAAERVRERDTAAAVVMLQAIATQAEASGELVIALLALARAGNATVQLQRVDTDRMVSEILQALQPPGAPVLPVHTQPLPPVDADPQLLRQVFANLLGNALKFSARRDAPHIEVGALTAAGGPVFFVKDNGVGFDGALSARLFEPFHRAHGGAFDGTGIGLSIVKRIVDSHGGRVWAESVPGEGAAFYFSLQGVSLQGAPPQNQAQRA